MVQLRSPLRRYYTPYEVAMHNTPDDCWVSFLGGVYDLTTLIKENPGILSEPLIRAAGHDISNWFDPKTKDVRTHIDPATDLERPYCPNGRFVHMPPTDPISHWDTSFGLPWWKDKKYFVGNLSSKTRVVRIKNVLTNQEDNLEVPCEEAVVEVRERYLALNWHAPSYTWKALIKDKEGNMAFQELNMNLTLAENGVPDEDAEFDTHQVARDYCIPVLHVYWNDDLTVA